MRAAAAVSPVRIALAREWWPEWGAPPSNGYWSAVTVPEVAPTPYRTVTKPARRTHIRLVPSDPRGPPLPLSAIATPTQLATITSNSSSVTSWSTGSITFPTNGQAVLGIIWMHLSGYTTTGPTVTVTDNLGNTWTTFVSVENTAGTAKQYTRVAYFLYASAGSNTAATVTVGFPSLNDRFGWCGYTTGHDTSDPRDASGTGSQTNTSLSTVTVSTTGNIARDGCLVMTGWGEATGSGSPAPSSWPTTGRTSLFQQTDATRHRGGAFEYQVLTTGSGAGQSDVIAYNVAGGACGVIACFKPFLATVPSNSVAPVESGTETVGSTLSCTTGTWTGSPTGYSYQWYRDVGTGGVTWLAISGATASTYALTIADVGSKVECSVIATNAAGDSSPTASNTTTVTIPAPTSLTWRLVAGPVAQSDNQTHLLPFDKPVLAGERLVIFAACSNANTVDGNGNQSNVGSFTDADGDTYVQDCEAFSDASIQHSCQAFSTVASVKKDYGDNLTMHVHGGTGAGAYHGQSPFWFAVALNAGDGRTFALDHQAHQVDVLTTHVAPSITTTNIAAIVFGFHAGEPGAGAGWWTPATGFTEIVDTAAANTLGGESAYNIAAEAKIVSAGYTGGAGGATGSNKTITNIVVAYSVISSQTVAIGQATDTNTAQTLTAKKAKALGQATETDTVQASTPVHKRTLGQTTETELAQPLANSHATTVGQATETDTALAATRHKTLAVGQTTESDTTQALTHHKTLAVGQASETDTAFSPVRAKTKAVGQATSTDTALTLTRKKSRSTGQASETDTAAGVSYVQGGTQVIPVGQASDTNTAQPVILRRTTAIGQALETDTVAAVRVNRHRTLGQPSDTSTAQAVTTVRRRLLGVATETDAALPFQTRVTLVVGQALEVDTALTLSTHTPFGIAAPIRAGRIATGSAGYIKTVGVD